MKALSIAREPRVPLRSSCHLELKFKMEVYSGEWAIYKFVTVPTPQFLLTAKRQDLCFRVKTELTCSTRCICWVSSPLSRCGLHSWRMHCGSDSTTEEETKRERDKYNLTKIRSTNTGATSPFGPAWDLPHLFEGLCTHQFWSDALQSQTEKPTHAVFTSPAPIQKHVHKLWFTKLNN